LSEIDSLASVNIICNWWFSIFQLALLWANSFIGLEISLQDGKIVAKSLDLEPHLGEPTKNKVSVFCFLRKK
jgi:hypothetical protein